MKHVSGIVSQIVYSVQNSSIREGGSERVILQSAESGAAVLN